jgi:hypothetical protein
MSRIVIETEGGKRMRIRKLAAVIGALALVTVIGATLAGVALAQTDTPPAQATPTTPQLGYWGRGFGFGGGSIATFDEIAKALNLTPTQLFEELHSGKTLSEIAEAQGVDLQKVQDTIKASQVQAMKDAIAQAVEDGKMTQEQADWLLEGLDKGYMPMGRGHFGFGRKGGHLDRGGMRGFGHWGPAPGEIPTPSSGTSS